jgi:putative aldouronate transport system substrate-binding protein
MFLEGKTMKVTRIIAMLLPVLMAGTMLAGCSGSKQNNAGSGQSTAEATSSAAATNASGSGDFKGPSGNTPVVNGKIDTSKFVTIKVVQLGDPPAGGADKRVLEELNKKLKEKVNAAIDWSWIEWNNYDTKYQMTLASGEPADLIFTSSTWLNLWDNADKGSFMNIEDLLPHYSPQLWADTTKQEWEGTTFKGHIVALPEHRFTQLSTPFAAYRQDWAQSFGIDKVDSIEKLGQYLQGIKDKMPNVTPYAATGSATSNELYSMYLRQKTKYVLGPGTTGMFTAVASKSYDEPWTIVSPIFDDWFIDFAKTMKKWGDAGYWPQDVMASKKDGKTTMLAGTSGMWTANVSNYYSFMSDFKKQQPNGKLDAFFFDGAPRNEIIKDVVTQDAASIGANAKNPERALMVYDLLQYDKEIYTLVHYGIEGQQYVLTSDGKRALPPGYDKNRDAYYFDLWSTRNDKFEIPSVDDDVAAIKAVNDKLFPLAKPNPWGSFHMDLTPVNAEAAAIGEVCSKYGPAIMYGKAGDPVKAVQDFRNALKTAGIDKYIAELQKQLDAYKATLK